MRLFFFCCVEHVEVKFLKVNVYKMRSTYNLLDYVLVPAVERVL